MKIVSIIVRVYVWCGLGMSLGFRLILGCCILFVVVLSFPGCWVPDVAYPEHSGSLLFPRYPFVSIPATGAFRRALAGAVATAAVMGVTPWGTSAVACFPFLRTELCEVWTLCV